MQRKLTMINTEYVKAAIKLAKEYARLHADEHPGHAHMGAVLVSDVGIIAASANDTENHAELNAYHTARESPYCEKRYNIGDCASQT